MTVQTELSDTENTMHAPMHDPNWFYFIANKFRSSLQSSISRPDFLGLQ